ncbi:MAG TPA: flagellar hook assembly protein FlgD [Spirochaetes bacterium]|nr:flagellar hook assembly protein FlgD [Spirochaetota bacterium]
MDMSFAMNTNDLFKTRLQVESFNKSIEKAGRNVTNTLGKDDFLKLLVVQLENQDPTKPLDDNEFISQMAQFSSLEQMTSINKTLSSLISNYKVTLSYSLLGKQVEVLDRATGEQNSGVVSEITFSGGRFEDEVPKISFNGLSYSVDDVVKVSMSRLD